MLALTFDGQVRVTEDHADVSPSPGEVVVGVRLAGVCRTDIEIAQGFLTFKRRVAYV